MHIIMPSFGVWGAILTVTRGIVVLPSYVLELFYCCETLRLVLLYVIVELRAGVELSISVVDCRQSGCSYSVELSCVEY
jgi:hypothetical protein